MSTARPLLAASLLAGVLACAPKPQQWSPPTAEVGEDAFMVDADFTCFQNWPQVGNSYFGMLSGSHGPAYAAADQGQLPYPVGTIVQMFPGEAMVKRHAGFSPETDDWEFFKLKTVDGQTVIVERGTTEIKNIAGGCAECHAAAAETHDWVCGAEGGCEPLPDFVVKRAHRAVEKDSRCKKRE